MLRWLVKHRKLEIVNVVNLIIIPFILFGYFTVILSDERSNRQVRRQQIFYNVSVCRVIWLVVTVCVLILTGPCYRH